MARISKRMGVIRKKHDSQEPLPVREALDALKACSTVKFDESVDIAVNLGVDTRKSEQAVRGALVLPKGIGKQVRVAVFAEGDAAAAAVEAGADAVGYEDLAEKMQGGDLNYDVVVATPAAMPFLAKLGKLLGPRGLMPSPKSGTVSPDTAQAVKNAKSGQVRYRTDKNGIVHCSVGRISFEIDALAENINALVAELKRVKPASIKGVYLRRMTLSSTMGIGIRIDQASLDA
ncbi:MAG: 50S ribosomal protein L1 [Candidatus Eutrophobiaceae bacterium]